MAPSSDLVGFRSCAVLITEACIALHCTEYCNALRCAAEDFTSEQTFPRGGRESPVFPFLFFLLPFFRSLLLIHYNPHQSAFMMAVLTLSWAVILTAAASFAPGFASAFSTTHSTYRIPATVQNEPAYVRFEVDTPGGILGIQSRQSLDAPMLDSINSSVFDWWYFDAVSLDDPRESLVLTFFTATADAFPFLDSTQKSVLIAYAWASFSNGSSWAGYLPATLATVDIGGDGEADGNVSSGMWEDTGFRWNASKEDLSAYEISVDSPELDVKGTLSFTSVRLLSICISLPFFIC